MNAPNVQIVDYGLGNLFSIRHACLHSGINAQITAQPEALLQADGIILPGVGAFGHAMETLRQLQLLQPLQEAAAAGKPLLGICLGMQLLLDASEEFGLHQGLGLIPGVVRKLPEIKKDGSVRRIPAVGWNQIRLNNTRSQTQIDCGLHDAAWMYFVHSFAAEPEHPSDVLTLTDYEEIQYCSAIQRDRVTGVQFHPERSAQHGLRFLKHWASGLSSTN
ncbi:MAG: imidazole glycerol phosphate synthase subunit HisH [Planctomycetaceae bacterium]